MKTSGWILTPLVLLLGVLITSEMVHLVAVTSEQLEARGERILVSYQDFAEAALGKTLGSCPKRVEEPACAARGATTPCTMWLLFFFPTAFIVIVASGIFPSVTGWWLSAVSSTLSLFGMIFGGLILESHNLQLTSPILWPWPLGGDVNDAGRKWWAVLLTSTTLFYSFVDIGSLLHNSAWIGVGLTLFCMVCVYGGTFAEFQSAEDFHDSCRSFEAVPFQSFGINVASASGPLESFLGTFSVFSYIMYAFAIVVTLPTLRSTMKDGLGVTLGWGITLHLLCSDAIYVPVTVVATEALLPPAWVAKRWVSILLRVAVALLRLLVAALDFIKMTNLTSAACVTMNNIILPILAFYSVPDLPSSRLRKLLHAVVLAFGVSSMVFGTISAILDLAASGNNLATGTFPRCLAAKTALPRRVRENLLEEVAMPVLESHPLFEFLSKIAHPEMARQCHKAIKEKSVIHGEEVFQPNSSADRMFFVQSGRLKYQPDISPLDSEDVLEGTRVAEATLWLKWEYRGRLNCEDHSAHFMALDDSRPCRIARAPFFRKAMARSSLCDSVTMYARLFLQALIETYPEEDEASDLFGRDDQLKSLVKTVKGDGAAKFSALGVQRGPDFVEAFDAWKEVWMQSRNRKVREKSCLGRFWKLFYQQTEGRSSNREVQRTVEVADVSEIEPIEPSGLSGLSDSESVE
eukprot:g33445.t1